MNDNKREENNSLSTDGEGDIKIQEEVIYFPRSDPKKKN